MLNFSDVSIRRGRRRLFAEATFSLFRGEKVSIAGENGSGKSSLMALVRGELQPDAGLFEMPSNLEIAHVSQELLATDSQAIEFVLDGDAELRTIERGIAAAEARDDGHKLGELYAHYAAVVLVSHDRHLLRTVADEFHVVHSGKAEPFDGDLEDYARWLTQTDQPPAEAQIVPATPELRKQRKRDEADRRNRLSPLKATIAQCERDLDRVAKELAGVQHDLAAPDIYGESAKDRLRTLLEKEARLQRETAVIEAAWLEATEQLETLERTVSSGQVAPPPP